MVVSYIQAKNRKHATKAMSEGRQAFENGAKLCDNPYKAPLTRAAWFEGFEESLRRYSLGLPKH